MKSEQCKLQIVAATQLLRDLDQCPGTCVTDRVVYRDDELGRRAGTVSPSAAAARVSLIHKCVQSMRQNANRQVALDSLLFGLRNLR